MKDMSIVAAMKELKVIKKRMSKNSEFITKYSSQPDSEKPLLGDAPQQQAEIKSLTQANEDLAKRFTEVHTALTYTNIMIKVNMDSKTYTIHELILMRRELFTLLRNTFNAMNDNNFNMATRSHSYSNDSKVHIERFYDEKWKTGKLRALEDLYHSIDSRLETINATTNLVEVPSS